MSFSTCFSILLFSYFRCCYRFYFFKYPSIFIQYILPCFYLSKNYFPLFLLQHLIKGINTNLYENQQRIYSLKLIKIVYFLFIFGIFKFWNFFSINRIFDFISVSFSFFLRFFFLFFDQLLDFFSLLLCVFDDW